ncbi:hypothetical protein L3Q82_015682 [Scortum barcoo]|uniref:Uncharacterized protein n=1 Tax=Scortum barcoo TaxID=214431 RepID=A0ACB8VNV6_9TELE|nr:hypothetical protein L3Q82_015682 [Scortum barcoo]
MALGPPREQSSHLSFPLCTHRNFTYSTDSCHLQKFSDDTAIVGCVSEGNDCEYRKVIMDFVDWCELNHLQVNASKTKEIVIDFGRKPSSEIAPVNIQGLDIERVRTYKYLGVHLNNKLDWTDNTDSLYKKGQSRLYMLRRLGSFGVCRPLLRTFYETVVASVVSYAVVCWGGGCSERDKKRLNRLIKRASSVCGCPLDSIEVMGERRALAKLSTIMDNTSHPLHQTVGALSSSFSNRLRHPRCRKERFLQVLHPKYHQTVQCCSMNLCHYNTSIPQETKIQKLHFIVQTMTNGNTVQRMYCMFMLQISRSMHTTASLELFYSDTIKTDADEL